MTTNPYPTITVTWSPEDQEYVATAEGYESLSDLDTNPETAVASLLLIIDEHRKTQALEWFDTAAKRIVTSTNDGTAAHARALISEAYQVARTLGLDPLKLVALNSYAVAAYGHPRP